MRHHVTLGAMAFLLSTACSKRDPDQPESGGAFKPIGEDALIGTWVCTYRLGKEVNDTGYFTWEFREDRSLFQDYPPDQPNQDHTFGWALGSYENRESLLLLDISPGPGGKINDFEQSVLRLDGDELTLWLPSRSDGGRLDYAGDMQFKFRRK